MYKHLWSSKGPYISVNYSSLQIKNKTITSIFTFQHNNLKIKTSYNRDSMLK